MVTWKVKVIVSFAAVAFASSAAYFHWLTAPQDLPQVNVHTNVQPPTPTPLPTEVEADSEPETPMDEYRRTLDRAEEYLQSTEGYTATFIRQIRKNERLHDRETISIKIRHDPFGVYMKWQDDEAQEVLYAAGENDGKLLARRAKGFFRNTAKLEPTSRLAMEGSRYPIYELGMLELVRNSKEALYACTDIDAIGCEVESTKLDGLPVRQFTITFDSPEMQPTYSRCVLHFTEDNGMPVQILSKGWADDGQPGELIEHYYYRDVLINPGFGSDEFSPEHEAYAFRR